MRPASIQIPCPNYGTEPVERLGTDIGKKVAQVFKSRLLLWDVSFKKSGHTQRQKRFSVKWVLYFLGRITKNCLLSTIEFEIVNSEIQTFSRFLVASRAIMMWMVFWGLECKQSKGWKWKPQKNFFKTVIGKNVLILSLALLSQHLNYSSLFKT